MLKRVCCRSIALLMLGFVLPVCFGQCKSSADLNSARMGCVEVFALGPVGYAATTSDGEKAYRAILTMPRAQALAIFNRLFETGNSQGKAYALAGIYGLDRARFDKMYTTLRSSGEIVSVERGCLRSDEKLNRVADEIRSGELK